MVLSWKASGQLRNMAWPEEAGKCSHNLPNKEWKEDNLSQALPVCFFLFVCFSGGGGVGCFCCWLFLWVFFFPQIRGWSHLFCSVICGVTFLVKQEMMPRSEFARNARKRYSNLSVVCVSQSCVGHDEMWCGKSYPSNAEDTERHKYWACIWLVSLCKVEHQGKAELAAGTRSFQDSSDTTLNIL